MNNALRPGLSFCRLGERYMFLDLASDRYFCLRGHAEAAFARAYNGLILSALDQQFLTKAGILVPEGGLPIRECHTSPAVDDFAPADMPRAKAWQLICGLVLNTAAGAQLKTFGLARTIRRLARRKTRAAGIPTGCDEPQRLLSIATGVLSANRLLGAQGRCLPNSLALAHRLLTHGIAPELILGVKLAPFEAHAWVQCGRWILGDACENTRKFTPILVV